MKSWDRFMREKLLYIFENSKTVIDIGGGLRAFEGRGDSYDPDRAWMRPYLEKLDYKIMDPVPDYNPDVIGDIHQMPFGDNSIDAIVCNAVLEHVENPIKACKEIHRVIRPGGYAFLYVPFIFNYHSEPGYFKDYWRFTHDTIELLFRDFARVETAKVRGAVATWMHVSPLGRYSVFKVLAGVLDKVFKKENSNQVSGYYIFAQK